MDELYDFHGEELRLAAAGERAMRPWLKWVKEAERLLGVKLAQCSEDEDGCSLDFAHDAFEAGKSPAAYVAGTARVAA